MCLRSNSLAQLEAAVIYWQPLNAEKMQRQYHSQQELYSAIVSKSMWTESLEDHKVQENPEKQYGHICRDNWLPLLLQHAPVYFDGGKCSLGRYHGTDVE